MEMERERERREEERERERDRLGLRKRKGEIKTQKENNWFPCVFSVYSVMWNWLLKSSERQILNGVGSLLFWRESIAMVDSKCSGMGPTSNAIDGAKTMSRQRQIMLSCDRIPIKEQFLHKIMKFMRAIFRLINPAYIYPMVLSRVCICKQLRAKYPCKFNCRSILYLIQIFSPRKTITTKQEKHQTKYEHPLLHAQWLIFSSS